MPTLLESVTSQAMRQRLDQLCAQRPDVRTLSYILGPVRILEWLHSVGVCSDETLRALVPPVPPQSLRSSVAAPEPEIFLWTGVVDVSNFMELYRQYRHAGDPAHPAVFDFGCGCGRLTRFLGCTGTVDAFASDINPDHVRWCQDNLQRVTTRRNGPRPPVPFADASFHLAYSLSIFTHLPEPLADLWLAEMARVLAPLGILILTTHGETALNVIRGSKIHQDLFGLDEHGAREIAEALAERQVVFLPYSADVLAVAKAGDDYGNAFIHPNYVHNRWNNERFRVLRHIPGGLRGWQDVIVLQRQ